MTKTQTCCEPTPEQMLAGAQATLTLMTATRLAAGMLPDAAFRSALTSFMAMCQS